MNIRNLGVERYLDLPKDLVSLFPSEPLHMS